MKFTPFTSILILAFTAFSCDTEDARTPLGITISAADFETTIEENPENGTVLGILEAFASDGSTIQFGKIIEEDSEESKFESETPIGALDIDDVTGELSIKDGSLFDFSLNTEINATVNAISGQVKEAININIFINPDRAVLLDIRTDNPTATLGWTDEVLETDISNWPGVTVIDGRVTALDLSGKSLTVLPTSISKISKLTNLNLSSNQLSSLPDTIGDLGSLIDLNLSINQLANDIPESIANLGNLTNLDLSSNNITLLATSICDAFNDFEGDSFTKDPEAICEEEVITDDGTNN